jgi:hypothetical protein
MATPVETSQSRNSGTVLPRWDGAQATTRAVLEAILRREPSAVISTLSREEFILVRVCEFWAAAMNRDLARYLEGSAPIRLSAAEESFTVIRAPAAKSAVRLARLRLRAADTVPLSEIAAQLEAILVALQEPVDALIAEFARRIAPP